MRGAPELLLGVALVLACAYMLHSTQKTFEASTGARVSPEGQRVTPPGMGPSQQTSSRTGAASVSSQNLNGG